MESTTAGKSTRELIAELHAIQSSLPSLTWDPIGYMTGMIAWWRKCREVDERLGFPPEHLREIKDAIVWREEYLAELKAARGWFGRSEVI